MTLKEFLLLARKQAPQGFRIKHYPVTNTVMAIPD